MVGNPSAAIEFMPGRPGDVGRLHADAAKFQKLCDWQPQIAFETGLARTIAYFRNHPAGLQTLLQEETGRNWEPS
jgi:dTDP-D-glucose 4,6-dehydratase